MNKVKKMNKWFIFTLIVCVADICLPFILAHFYPGYNNTTMVMSSLGGGKSPVRAIYNVWMMCLGISIISIGIHIFNAYKDKSEIVSILLLITTLCYALFDCIASSLFSIGETKEMLTVSEKIHGYGSAIGCTLFVLGGFLAVILLWKEHVVVGKLMAINFIVSLITFVIFVGGENVSHDIKGAARIFTYQGLWQRISFSFMYMPYVVLNFKWR